MAERKIDIKDATPRPWKRACFLITGPNGEHVTHTGSGNLPPSRSHESEANAELIFQAVQAFDKQQQDKHSGKWPIGTKVKFPRNVESPSNEEHPHLIYAWAGETGEVVGHNDWEYEGYLVKSDNSPHPFGISPNEFEPQGVSNFIPLTALYWLKQAKDESQSTPERLFNMEQAYNHVVNALHAKDKGLKELKQSVQSRLERYTAERDKCHKGDLDWMRIEQCRETTANILAEFPSCS
jgi:hypothetical protein